MSTQQFVIMSKESGEGGELPVVGTRDDIVSRLARFNTMPEQEGQDLLYGPGICIQLPPGSEPIRQMLMTIVEEEIAWQVISRIVREMQWKLLDPATGRELNG